MNRSGEILILNSALIGGASRLSVRLFCLRTSLCPLRHFRARFCANFSRTALYFAFSIPPSADQQRSVISSALSWIKRISDKHLLTSCLRMRWGIVGR
jgi:hypothetical protein